MTQLQAIGWGLLAGAILNLLRDSLPRYVAARGWIEANQPNNMPPLKAALGFVFLVWRASSGAAKAAPALARVTATAFGPRWDVSERPVPFGRIGVLLASVAIVLAAAHGSIAHPAVVPTSIGCLLILLCALTSFDCRLIPDVAVLAAAVLGTASAIYWGSIAPAAAFEGALAGYALPWAVRAILGLNDLEPIGFAVPKLSGTVGIWVGTDGVLAALALATLAMVVFEPRRPQEASTSSDDHLPFGGYLGVAALMVILVWPLLGN